MGFVTNEAVSSPSLLTLLRSWVAHDQPNPQFQARLPLSFDRVAGPRCRRRRQCDMSRDIWPPGRNPSKKKADSDHVDPVALVADEAPILTPDAAGCSLGLFELTWLDPNQMLG